MRIPLLIAIFALALPGSVLGQQGHLAWATFDYTLEGEFEYEPVAVDGRGTVVLRHMPDGWQIIHSHTSGKRR